MEFTQNLGFSLRGSPLQLFNSLANIQPPPHSGYKEHLRHFSGTNKPSLQLVNSSDVLQIYGKGVSRIFPIVYLESAQHFATFPYKSREIPDIPH